MAKLFERLVHHRLTWFLEVNDLLPHEQTGFRAHLAAQDSLLDFHSALEHNRAIGNYTLAAFLDVQSAFDRVGARTAVDNLQALGLRGRLLCFLQRYLNGRVFSVKLGNVVSSSRPLLRGLPQGSVLSPTLFNVVMARVISSLISDPMLGMGTFYADDICVWSTGTSVPVIVENLQTLLDQLVERLEEVGLDISTDKSRFLLFSGRGRRTRQAALHIKGELIPRTKEHRFLGVVVDERNNGVAQVQSILAATKGPANAIKRLCGTRWGSSPSALLHLHNALVVSRLTYVLPYLTLSKHQQLILERVHRAGIKTALGVPRSPSTAEMHAEISSVSIMNCTSD